MTMIILTVAVMISTCCFCVAFHDCIQAGRLLRKRRSRFLLLQNPTNNRDSFEPSSARPGVNLYNKTTSLCSGGLCVGMARGPHQGGNSSYPVAWNGTRGTFLHSTMTVPELPKQQLDGITYYLWTDVFFGDASMGRMNQLVPQLILGSALDSSSGPPLYHPFWHRHSTWAFGSHYFFETVDSSTKEPVARAAYGPLHPTWPGEVLYTTFELVPGGDGMDQNSPKWVLTMGVVGDDSRVSRLEVDRPYMGMGETWEEPTKSWTEPPYRNMCINACWELYGATDSAHLPSGGARYDMTIVQPETSTPGSQNGYYNFTSNWEQDEGNGYCPSCRVQESHTERIQHIGIDIRVQAPSDLYGQGRNMGGTNQELDGASV